MPDPFLRGRDLLGALDELLVADRARFVQLVQPGELIARRGRRASRCRHGSRSRRELLQSLAPQRDDSDREQSAEEQDPPPGAQRVRATPEDEEQIDEADGSPDDSLPLVQDWSEPLAEPDCRRGGPGEDRSERRDSAVEKRSSADLAEDRGTDQPEAVRRGLVARGRERISDVVPE